MFKNLKIKIKLGVGFGVVLLLTVVMLVLGIYQMGQINEHLKRIVNVNNVKVKLANDAGLAIANILSGTRIISLVTTDEAFNAEREKIDAERKKYREAIATIKNMDSSKDNTDLVAHIEDAIVPAKAANNKFIELKNAHKTAEANAVLLTEAIPLTQKISDEIDKLIKYQEGRSKIRYEEAVTDYGNARLILLVIGGIAIMFSLTISFLISRSITSPLQKGIDVADKIAKGDLTSDDLDATARDETGALAKSLNAMKHSLSDMIGKFSDTSSHVASSSEELSATVTQITKRVDEQSSKANQVATASAQMSQTVIDIAKNSANIASSSTDTLQTAEDGAEVVRKTVNEVQEIARTVAGLAKLMASLGDRSVQIGEIVSVIKDIADQTNLLALNAAIEAARAGEQGRGFAVVADEVRKLAEKTAQSTSEIGNMIKAIQDETEKAVTSMGEGTKKVQSGVELATHAGSALNMIVNSVNSLQSMVQQIASATEEMSTVSEQISCDIEVIAAVSKETSSGSYQIAQEATNLSKLSTDLKTEAGRFRVNGKGNGHSSGMN
jgi:methyl-accepting chemotaxis protein